MGNVKKNAASYGIVLSACLLVVLGDVRSLISPAGYWALWGLIVVVGLISAPERLSFKVSPELAVYILGFFVLFSAFVLSALANAEIQTFYQGLKMMCIGGVFVCVYAHSQFLEQGDYHSIASRSILTGFLVFCMAKYYLTGLYIELGDGRQGSLFAYPGVLWKTCAFFAGFVIVGTLFDGRSKVTSLLVMIAGAYILVMDSSRTGFIVFLLVILLILLLSMHVRPKLTLLLFFISIISFTAVLMLYSTGYDILNFNQNPLVVDRLAAGDPVRARMLADGLRSFETCMPFGCGFGSTTSEVDGSPMVVHNAFISSGGDLGILGFIGLLILIFSPLLIFAIRLCRYAMHEHKAKYIFIYAIAALGGSLGFALLLMLHPFSTELSEWGIWILMTSALSVLSRQFIMSEHVQVTGGDDENEVAI